MVVRFLGGSDVITDDFLGLIPFTDANSNTLYQSVVKFFTENNIPYKQNVIGFAAGGADSMLGLSLIHI